MHALGERADGQWSGPTVGLVVGRQNGKGSILEARELAGLFLLGEELIIHTAHRQKIATNHFRRLRTLIRGVPELMARVAKMPEGKGSEAIELRDGRRIEFATRQSGNARGLTADLIVYDEAMFLTEDDRSGTSPTMAARSMTGNIQTWYVGSAVDKEDPAQDGVPFAQIREAGIAGTAGVAYFEWSASGEDPDKVSDATRRDPHAWAQANPGLGKRISAEWIERERTVEMGARGFAVERLSIGDWPDTSEESGRVIPSATWEALAERDEANHITSTPTYAVDASPDHAWAAVGVAGQRDDKLRQVAVVEHARGTDWVIDCCSRLQKRDKRSVFVVDGKGPAASLIDDLKDAGVKVLIASAEDYGNACAQFLNAVTSGHVRYPAPQPELDDAVAAARETTLGDRWKWARRTSTSPDISTLVAVTLALWGHLRKPAAARVINPYDYI